jgi:hypothetical protein
MIMWVLLADYLDELVLILLQTLEHIDKHAIEHVDDCKAAT